MKTLQIHTGFLVISLSLLLACKAFPKKETFTMDTYAIINTILDDYKEKDRPFVLIKESSKLTVEDFISQINGQLRLKDEGYNPEHCAMHHIERNVELYKVGFTPKTWDSSKIVTNDVKYISREELGKNLSLKAANELMVKQIFSFSSPIYDKSMNNAVILVEISREGQTLHFLHKEKGYWNIICKYFTSYY